MSASLVDFDQAKAYVDSLLAHIQVLQNIIAEKDKQLQQQGATLNTAVTANANVVNAAASALQKLTVGPGHARRAVTTGHNRSALSGPSVREVKCKNGDACNGLWQNKDGEFVDCKCGKKPAQ